ncbi:MAG: TetR/AcrR family transcriptional regulator [Acidimicrobiales bacterium]
MAKQPAETRRLDILETACAVVIERGFAATRVSDVANRLGVSSSLIHYHFDSKESLLASAFEHYARKDIAEMISDIDSAPSHAERLVRLLETYVPEGSDDLEWMLWIDAWGEALRNPLMKRISQQLDEQSNALLEDIITDGVREGAFDCPDPHVSSARITALIDGLAIQYAAHDGMVDRSGLLASVVAVAEREVGARLAHLAGADSPAAPEPPDASGRTHDGIPRVHLCPRCGSGHICPSH